MTEMAKTMTRRALLDRWRGIQEEDDDDRIDHPLQHRFLRQLKEEWFSDAFNFLISLPRGQHTWCGSWDLMGPLLETFYNYFKDEAAGSPLKILWTRISNEMRQCTQCICHHHQAQETYNTEYEPSSIGPLLEVLHTLDEERVSRHLKEINARVAQGQYDAHENAEVVCLMFEILMFPYLLEDQLLATEFETLIEAIDNSHELTLAGHQHYPGVYALLFLKSRRARSIGFRLAGQQGRLRKSVDLEPLQPLLKKCFSFLETDMVPLAEEPSRPRVQLERITVWLGIKALLGFLEPPAFEEGILDRYPVFLSIVLNHISDDSLEFSYAVNCLRLLFEMLGCKLWLRSTLSASVMRNTLLGQCFHTRSEKSHKEIFDLFLPFLQSLEALQDGEHEKQRRHFLYFLLHQVTVSSNFSILMRKKACQIALLIVYRGYRMNPPCPPYECAHIWGPSLVSSLKDSSLHSSLRQPAFDLIETIIISDASVMVASVLKTHFSNDRVIPIACADENDEQMLFERDVKEKDVSSWTEFHLQCQITSLVYGGWMCIPMLWFDVLVGIDPSILPVSFTKAVFWGVSRLSMLSLDNSNTIDPSVENWLKNFAAEISHLFRWKVPSGSDDGGDGMVSKNSIILSKMCMPLIRTFRRFASHYIARMEQGELIKQWTWEPMMAESLILLLFDPDDNVRQVSRHILEQFCNGRGLTCGLQFLCSSQSSLVAIFIGLRHALKLVQLDSVLINFQMLHHFFFVLCKIIKEGYSSTTSMVGNSSGILNSSQFSSQGGFLTLPVFATRVDNLGSAVSSTVWEKFCCSISEIAWSTVQKCLAKGKAFIDHKISQMTCIRLLEILPVIFERFFWSPSIVIKSNLDMGWLHDLMDWGRSSLPVVVRYWKQTLASLLSLFKKSCNNVSASAIKDIEKLLASDNVAMDKLSDQIARLSVSLMDEGCFTHNQIRLKSKSSITEELLQARSCSVENVDLIPVMDVTVHPYSKKSVDKEKTDVILLSDDEEEPETVLSQEIQSHIGLSQHILDAKVVSSSAIDRVLHPNLEGKFHPETSSMRDPPKALPQGSSLVFYDLPIQNLESNKFEDKLVPASHVKSKCIDNSVTEELSTKGRVQVSCSPQDLSHVDFSGETKDLGRTGPPVSQLGFNMKRLSVKNTNFKSDDHKSIDKVRSKSEAVIHEVLQDTEDDLWEFSFFKSARLQKSFSKPINSAPKRQVIQLKLPVENRSGQMRVDGQIRRFKAPRLDDWYKPILELDYFSTVGLVSDNADENKMVKKLKEVPVCFKSPDEYVEVFRPLVLEEFKAQLNSSFQEMVSVEEMCCGTLSVLSIERVDDFHILRCVHEDTDASASRSCLEHDLILLTRQPLPSSFNDIHMVGKVERREIDNKRKLNILVIRLYLQNGCSRLNRARKLFVERSKWFIGRLMSITPQLREFQALSSIKEIPLLPVILNPISHPYDCHKSKRENLSKLSRPLQQVLQSSFDDSQLQAISTAIGSLGLKRDFELSLIQGPPGTGKTRTILAIVSGLLAFSHLRDDKKSPNDYPKSTTISRTHSRSQINQSAAIARAWQDAALARQLNEDAERNNTPMSSCSRGCRVLICAQSNAAVDELVSRISTEGLFGSDGVTYKPFLVRVGNAKTIHPNSLPFFIDTLVDQRLSEERVKGGKDVTGGDSILTLRSNLESLVDQIRFYEAKRVNLREDSEATRNLLQGEAAAKDCEMEELSDAELEAKLRRLYEKKKVIYKDLSSAQAQEKKASEEIKALRHKLRRSILKEAEIILTTLSGCGGDLYGVCAESVSCNKFSSSSESTLFDAVVIDEAAQALEPATLIPLQLLKSKRTRCIMVGDPKQLPATVLSNIASKYLFQCSMFERLQRAGHPVIMLTQQYRMHPEICRFPALHFYDGKLKNGNDIASKAAAFHETNGLGPYVFFDIIDGQESHGKNSSALSLYNECEALAAVEVLKFFKKRYPLEFIGGRIGIVTPYKSQLSLLRSRFAQAFGSPIMAEMEFNTVDGFQGREVDILVLSTVRAAEPSTSTHRLNSTSIGFVADVRRMNVALTRARLSLWIIGNARTLQTNENWAALLKDAKARGLVIPVRRPYSSFFKSTIKKDPAVEGPGNHFKPLQHVEKVKPMNEHAAVQKERGKDMFERRRMVNQACMDAVMGENEHFHPDAVRENKRVVNASDSLPTNDAASAVAENNESQNSKCLISGVSKNGKSSNRTRDRLIKIQNITVSEGNSNENLMSNSEKFEKVKGETQTGLDSTASIECLESLKCKERQPTKDPRSRSAKGSLKEKDVRNADKASCEVEMPKKTIVERKQQRDAVDALLSSALISSRKPESSLKSLSVKRNLSSTSAGGCPIRPPKSRRGS